MMTHHTSLKKHKLKALFTLSLLFSFILNGQEITGEIIPFTQIYPGPNDSSIIRGDMKIIGNSILGIQGTANDGTPTIYNPNDTYNGTSRNNGVVRGYIDIDSDTNFDSVFNKPLPSSQTDYSGAINLYGSPVNTTQSDTGTFSSSTAQLSISNPSRLPFQSCLTVVKAFLYWGAVYENESVDPVENSNDIERPDCINLDGSPCEFYTDIKILPPNATEYVDIKYNNSGADYTSLMSRVIIDGAAGRVHSFSNTQSVRNQTYVCAADVTSLFTHLQREGENVEGNWTVANVRATTGLKNTGSTGGWSLVVIYEDPLASFQKNIFMYDGYASITKPVNESFAAVEFNISGFETAPVGPVNIDIATISLEGDTDIFGDQFQINDQNEDLSKSENWAGVTYPGQDVLNFYDSSIYSKGPVNRFPNSTNTLGYDSDHFQISNPQNDYIGNNDNEADFRLFTEGDAFASFFTAFAFEIITPDLEVIKRVYKSDGSEFNTNDDVNLGDTINYEITITNTGNDDVVDATFTSTIPIHTILNSVTLGGITLSNEEFTIVNITVIDPLTGLSLDTKQISFTIPDTLVELGESVVVAYNVSAISDCLLLQNTCINEIRSKEVLTYFGEINNNNGSLFVVTSSYESIGCGISSSGPTLILNTENSCHITPQTSDIAICTDIFELEGGLGFEEYQWFLEDVPLTTNIDGSPIDSSKNTLLIDQSGTYRLNQIKSIDQSFLSCKNVELLFNVELFDPSNTPENPLADFGQVLVCSEDGTETTEILLCNEPIEISTNFSDNTIYSWQKRDESINCTQNSENCSFTNTSLKNCYVEISNDPIFTLTELDSYKLSITTTGGCQFNYFFKAIDNCSTLDTLSFEYTIEPNFSTFPNPVVDVLNVNTTNNDIESITIYNVQGKTILSQEFNETINIENFNPGMYFIVLNSKENQVAKKFIKE